MENIFEALRQGINEHSMDVALFVSGSLGALMSDNGKEVKLSKKQRTARMFFGGITAIYGTKILILTIEHLFSIEFPSETYAGVGFFLGHIGLAGITKLMIRYSERKKK